MKLLKLKDAGKTLARPVSRQTLRNWNRRGLHGVRLPLTRIGGRLYCDPEELRRFTAAVAEAIDAGAPH